MTLPRPNALKPRLLAIDDDRFNINTLIGLLEDEYDIAVAINGQMGLEAANKLLPDLILLDITMPDMSGFEVLSALKSSEQTSDIPVVF
ncbi:MAG: response regulator, partial [Cellvibrionales bacterium]